jgi:hypothetical protein
METTKTFSINCHSVQLTLRPFGVLPLEDFTFTLHLFLQKVAGYLLEFDKDVF